VPTATLYTGSTGINNKLRPERLPFDPKTGVTGLQTAENVVIDPSGAITSVRAPLLAEDGIYTSLVEDVHGYGYGFVLKHRQETNDAAILRVDVDDSGEPIFTGVRSGLDFGKKMSWVWVPTKGSHRVFYTNGSQFGWIDGYQSLAWPEDLYQTEETSIEFVQLDDFFKQYPPEHLGFNWGSIFFSYKGNDGSQCLGYSEYGGNYGLFQPKRNFIQFPDRITMFAPAPDGHYVGTESGIYFLSGPDHDNMIQQLVYQHPPVEYGTCRRPVDASFLGFESSVPVYVTPTTKGPVALLPSGQVYNLIDKSVNMPQQCKSGSIGIFDESLIIQTHE
jgi:hypothetical protein